jgi:hypothetical protein
MAPNMTSQKKTPKFLDAKVFIAVASLGITVGLWNVLSTQTLGVAKTSTAAVVAPPPNPSSDSAQGLPPIPTLIPLVDAAYQPAVSQNGVNTSLDTTELKSVTTTDQKIVQKGKVVIDIQAPPSAASSNGGQNNSSSSQPAASAPAPVTTTKAS